MPEPLNDIERVIQALNGIASRLEAIESTLRKLDPAPVLEMPEVRLSGPVLPFRRRE